MLRGQKRNTDISRAVGAPAPASQKARFVANTPLYVGGQIEGESSDESYDSSEESEFDNLSDSDFTTLPTPHYSTRTKGYIKNTKTGKKIIAPAQPTGDLSIVEEITPTTPVSSKVVQPLLNLLQTTGLESGAEERIEEVVSLSVGLNRMHSLSTRNNALLTTELAAETHGSITHAKFGTYWEVQWYDNKGGEVEFSAVRSFYKKLKRYDQEHDTSYAPKFLSANESGVEVPYQSLRQWAKNHKSTKELVALARAEDGTDPV